MWATSYVSPRSPLIHAILKPARTPRSPLSLAVSAGKSPPPAANDGVGGLGRTILTAVEPNPNPNPKPTNAIPIPQKQKSRPQEEQDEEEKQISGSDVLWALQKAAAKKRKVSAKNKNKKKIGLRRGSLSSEAGNGGLEVAGDYGDVRPLMVKSEWSGKLDELEKRLRKLSHTK